MREKKKEEETTDSVIRLNPNFEVAAFQSLHGELHLGELVGTRTARRRSKRQRLGIWNPLRKQRDEP